MVIREAGLLFRGYSLINAKYHQTGNKIDNDLRSGLFTALLNFAGHAFTKNEIEYFEGKKYAIAFSEGRIRSKDSRNPESLIAYTILDKHKNIGKYIHKIVQPLLKESLEEFTKEYEGKYLSEILQFKGFKKKLDKIFSSDSKTVDQKFEDLFTGR
ncbi:MAG: hypothetical protein P8Y70_07765 [Candidatus Lokiarchaeota archaeon]